MSATTAVGFVKTIVMLKFFVSKHGGCPCPFDGAQRAPKRTNILTKLKLAC